MSLRAKLGSKHFFIFNLVLLGALFGFSLAFLSFSCSTPGKSALAQNAVSVPQDALAVAESLQTAFRSVADQVLPVVVEIKTVSVSRQPSTQFNGIPWEFFFGPRGGENNNNKEREYRSQGLGSGIIVRRDRDTYFVLTNNHVVSDVTEIEVVDNNGEEYKAEMVGSDERRDLAMVKFSSPKETHPVAVLGDSGSLKVGDWAIAVGSPLGYMSSVTMGIVSALGREGGPSNNINDFIQTDASINQGNSGGALVNIRGEVVGINTWIASNNSAGSIGLGFAIPINNAKSAIDDLIDKGEITSGWLGILMTEPDSDVKDALSVSGKRGAFVTMLFIGSPAEKGGMQPGDFITHVNGREVTGTTALSRIVGNFKAGEKVSFTVVRDGKARDIQVNIAARTNDIASDNSKLWPGLQVLPITDELREEAELGKSVQGLYVTAVTEKSPAAVIGLQREDVITKVNGEGVRDLAAFYRLLREKAGKELWFEVNRGGSNIETLKFKR